MTNPPNEKQTTHWKAISLLAHERHAIPLIKKTFAEHEIEIYSPRYCETIFHKGRRKFVVTERRMVPKILLIRFAIDDKELWYRLQGLSCVAYILRGHATQQEVDRLKEKEQQLKTTKPIKLSFDVGDKVQITEGAMVGTVGTIKTISINHRTAQVAVDMFGRQTLVEVYTNALEIII